MRLGRSGHLRGIGVCAARWEWEAPATEYVSIGTCGTEFPSVVGVFTGEAFPPMPAGVDLNSGGPECSTQVVLPAVAGTVYDIGADGNLFEPPGGPPLSGEGTIHLRIASLPPPPNDGRLPDRAG